MRKVGKQIVLRMQVTRDWFVAKIITSSFLNEDYQSLENEAEKVVFVYKLLNTIRNALLFILLVVIFLVVTLSMPPGKGDIAGQYRHIYPSHQSAPTGQSVSNKIGQQESASIERLPPKEQDYEESLNEYFKQKRDINAQEGMWRAANSLVVLTLFQVFVGGFTVYFLIMTFRTQRSELGQAKRSADAAESAVRAYVFSSDIHLSRVHDDIRWVVDWKNSGRTPVKRCSSHGEMLILEPDAKNFEVWIIDQHYEDQNTTLATEAEFGHHITEGVTVESIDEAFRQGKEILVASSVYYTTIFDTDHIESIMYRILPKDRQNGFALPSNGRQIDSNSLFTWSYKKPDLS